MNRRAIAAAACLMASTAFGAPIQYEFDAKITALNGDYRILFGDFYVGDDLLIQIEVDESLPRTRVDYRIFFNGQLHTIPLPDFTGSTADIVEPVLHPHNTGAFAEPDHLGSFSEAWAYGYQHGKDSNDYYWEHADVMLETSFFADISTIDQSPFLSARGLENIADYSSPLLYSIGDYTLSYVTRDCSGMEIYGCKTSPTDYGFGWFDAHVGWEGSNIRRGWTDMTATVSAGPLAPLLGLLLFAAVSVRHTRR